MNDIERDVRAFLDENFILDTEAGLLAGDASLTRAGVLDSMGVLELITFLETTYGFTVPDEDTLPEHLDAVDRIVRYVETHRTDAGAGG